MDHIRITQDALDPAAAVTLVTHPSCGAISQFIGITRETCDGKNVLRLEYEAYVSMAEKMLKEIAADIRQKWAVHHMVLEHRLGVVPVSEASVVITVSSAHRKAALAAVEHAIDEVKARVPIWKREVYEDERAEWKSNSECFWTGNS